MEVLLLWNAENDVHLTTMKPFRAMCTWHLEGSHIVAYS